MRFVFPVVFSVAMLLAAVAATPAPAPDVTPEPKLDAAPKAQLAPEVQPKVKPGAGPAIPPPSDTLPATNAAPIFVQQSATRAPNDPAVQLDSDEMTRLIKRGKDFLAQGNFASARLLFKRAADAGSALEPGPSSKAASSPLASTLGDRRICTAAAVTRTPARAPRLTRSSLHTRPRGARSSGAAARPGTPRARAPAR